MPIERADLLNFILYEKYPELKFMIGEEVVILSEIKLPNPLNSSVVDGIVLSKSGLGELEMGWEYLVRGKAYKANELLKKDAAEEIVKFSKQKIQEG